MMLGFSDSEIGFAAMVMGTIVICFVFWILTRHLRRSRIAAYNARLKQLMIERGMTADEIVRVLEAGNDGKLDRRLYRCSSESECALG